MATNIRTFKGNRPYLRLDKNKDYSLNHDLSAWPQILLELVHQIL